MHATKKHQISHSLGFSATVSLKLPYDTVVVVNKQIKQLVVAGVAACNNRMLLQSSFAHSGATTGALSSDGAFSQWATSVARSSIAVLPVTPSRSDGVGQQHTSPTVTAQHSTAMATLLLDTHIKGGLIATFRDTSERRYEAPLDVSVEQWRRHYCVVLRRAVIVGDVCCCPTPSLREGATGSTAMPLRATLVAHCEKAPSEDDAPRSELNKNLELRAQIATIVTTSTGTIAAACTAAHSVELKEGGAHLNLSFRTLLVNSLSPDGEALLSLLSAADPYYKKLSPILSSWNPSSLTPCSWQGITCSPQERVISLSLPNTFLNLSSLPLELSSLSSLQLLNLSTTNISGSIPPSFGSLTHLRLLDLSSNSLSGPIPPELGRLTALQFLFLNTNRLTGTIPKQLANLSSLEVLCLQDNLLNGSIPSQLGSLGSLQQLRIGGNPYLTGEIPSQLGLLTNLTTFGAAATGLSGVIPPTFGNLINLQTLALYDTEVFGSIPPELGECLELRNLYLHMNKLTGPIPPQLGKLQKLTSMLLWGNSLSGTIPSELSNCSSLVVLDASANDLSSEIPGDLGKLLVLEQIHLSDNALTGSIPWELSNCTSLTALQLDKNQLSGPIPTQIGELKYLQSFFLWGNSVSGTIPPAFGNCTELYALDLSRNKLTGSIPDEIFSLKKLSKLLLLGNSLSGGLPQSVARCQSLVRLRLGENQLSGQIPKEIGQLQNLVFLDLYMNHFSGGLPSDIANITVLELLDLHSNYMTGDIPPQLGALVNLEQLDLSRNSFSGEIPWSFGNFSYLNKLILNNNLLTREIPKSIRNLQKLTLLDLSSNSLSGPIPLEIGYLTSLTISLDLSSNRFTGEIPETMSSLTQLQSLDLSRNTLHGKITILSFLTSLTSLNISYNNFSGPIPVTPFFRTLTSNSFIENSRLCESLDGATCSSHLMSGKGLKSAKTITLVAVIVASVTMAVVATWILVSRNHMSVVEKSGLSNSSGEEDFSYPWTFIPFQKLNFTIENILNCLRDENVIGKGCSGVVFKAETPNGDLIAVKKLWKTKKDEEPVDSFAAEIQILGHIRHRNIVKLLGYCSNKSVKLLLYNYIPNGNLQQLLQNNRNLDWETSYGVVLLEILSGRSAVESQIGDGLHIVEWVKKKMGSFEPAVTILDSKLQGLPDQMVQEMLQTLGIAMFCVNSSPAERPTMKEVVALLMEVKSPQEESGKTSQPLIKQSSNQS
ncbi:unnamed protein product [Fraxinus pennsylvanica]|uniref:Protein kinase domain-containing protein n=1 Tax=Fraxinus pennsylvanica TaxID=56036 RepID=A0AAD2DTD6_9LAMI|nr:unnamed protein product [Fraxinus pennsylvanica]